MATLKLQSMSRRTRLAFVLLLALAPLPLLLWRAMPARAADFVVTSCTMQGVADVLNANTSANISFNCGGPATITFTQPGGLNVLANQSFTIDGGDVITLSGLQTYRLFDVQAGGALTLTHIVLADGYATVGGNLPTQGGALLAEGNLLVLDHATVRRSVSSFAGGAIEVATGTAILLDSLIEDNQSDYGGGIDSIGALTLIRTTVRSNHALSRGSPCASSQHASPL